MLITYINNFPEYYSAVADWYMTFWGEKYPDRTNADWQAYLGKNNDKLPITLIAIDNNTNPPTLVGTASLRLNGMEKCDPDTAWLSGVYVPPEHRGKGTATELIKEAIKVASKHYDQLYLFTRTDGKIYKNLGWRTISKQEYQGSNVLVMSNFLASKIDWKFYPKQSSEQAPQDKKEKPGISTNNFFEAKL